MIHAHVPTMHLDVDVVACKTLTLTVTVTVARRMIHFDSALMLNMRRL